MYIIYNGENFVSKNEITDNYYKALKFRKKQAALNVAMRQKRQNDLKWVVLDDSKITANTIEEAFFETKKELETADFMVGVKFICDKYVKKNFVYNEKEYESEKTYFLKHNKFKKPIIMNSACIIIDNYNTYLISLELDIEEVPCIINSNFIEYLKDEIELKHRERLLIRQKVYEKAGGKCLMCHKQLQNDNPKNMKTYMTIDHIYPKSKGGENNINNYQCLCQKCNRIKGNIVTPYNDLLASGM